MASMGGGQWDPVSKSDWQGQHLRLIAVGCRKEGVQCCASFQAGETCISKGLEGSKWNQCHYFIKNQKHSQQLRKLKLNASS